MSGFNLEFVGVLLDQDFDLILDAELETIIAELEKGWTNETISE